MKRILTVPLLLSLLDSSVAFNFPSWSTISIPAAFGDTSLLRVQILASRLASKGSESASRPYLDENLYEHGKLIGTEALRPYHAEGETITEHNGKLMGTGGTVMVRPTNTQQKQVWTALENLERDS
jgi:hypothetical protein